MFCLIFLHSAIISIGGETQYLPYAGFFTHRLQYPWHYYISTPSQYFVFAHWMLCTGVGWMFTMPPPPPLKLPNGVEWRLLVKEAIPYIFFFLNGRTNNGFIICFLYFVNSFYHKTFHSPITKSLLPPSLWKLAERSLIY